MENTVLFVDDEVLILSAIRRAMRGEKFTAIFANSGEEALQIMAKREIKVLVTDMRMPGMNGLDLLKIVKENDPNTIKMVLSGYTQLSQVMATINQGDIFRFITKPWNSSEDLIATVEQGLEYYNIKKDRAELEKNLEQKNKAYQNILKTMNEKFDYVNVGIKNIRTLNERMFENLAAGFSGQGSEGPHVHHLTFFRYIQGLYLDTMLIPSKGFTLDEYTRAVQQGLDHRVKITLEGELAHKQLTLGGNLKFIVGVIELFVTEGNKQRQNENQDITITLIGKGDGLISSIRWRAMSQSSDWLVKIAPLVGGIKDLLQQNGIGVEFSDDDGKGCSIEMTIMPLPSNTQFA